MTFIRRHINGIRNNYEVFSDGRIISLQTGKEVHKSPNNGYLDVRLKHPKTGQMKTLKVHRIIAECFLPRPTGKYHVFHKNHNKHDNRLHNLKWCSSKELNEHYFKKRFHSVSNANKVRWSRPGEHERMSLLMKEKMKNRDIWGSNNPNYTYSFLYNGKEYSRIELEKELNVTEDWIYRNNRNKRLSKSNEFDKLGIKVIIKRECQSTIEKKTLIDVEKHWSIEKRKRRLLSRVLGIMITQGSARHLSRMKRKMVI